MNSGLKITVSDTDNPYGTLVAGYLAQEFPANLDNKSCVLESLTAAIVASSKVRFGPIPSPESLVAIRKVITSKVEHGEPIPVLCPWGSKKPNNGGIDIAELGGLKSLACLQKRVTAFYPAGLLVNLRIEDVGGYYLFANEGPETRASSEKYVADFARLIRILNLGFVNTKLESEMMNEAEFVRTAELVRPILLQYIIDTDQFGFENYTSLDSWQKLAKLGWKGEIPVEQRDYYRQRYTRLYPGISLLEQTNKLATYLAGSLARYQLKASGAEESWGSNFIQLNFTPPTPGTPITMSERRIYYRTLPESMAKTHLPAWRARGYVKINGNEVTPKIASPSEQLELVPSVVTFSCNGESVDVQADQVIV